MAKIVRILMAMVWLIGSFASTADAGGYRCGNRYCKTCYPQQSTYKAKGWRETYAEYLKQREDNQAFNQAWGQALGVQAPQYGHGGTLNYSTEYSSYPVQGNTLYGVSAYSSSPLLDLGALHSGQQKLTAQLTASAHQAASDTADLTSQAYVLEADRQQKLAAYEAITAVSQGAPAQPTAESFRTQQSLTFEGTPSNPQVLAVTAGHTFDSVIANQCVKCHAGAEAKGGLDMSGDVSFEQVESIYDAVRTGKMPVKKGESGFEPAERLSLEEEAAIASEYLRMKSVQTN